MSERAIRRLRSAVAAALALSATLVGAASTAAVTIPYAPGLIAVQAGHEIWSVRPDGSDPRFVVQGTRPAWSPDGDSLAFEVVRDGRSYVATVRSDGSGEHVLARGMRPVWSPDGTRLAFVRSVGGLWTVFVMRADGRRLREIGEGGTPTWSADGSHIAFLRRFDVWTAAVDGTDQQQVTATAPSGSDLGSVLDVDWSPDGLQIAYVSDGDLAETSGLFLISPSGSDPVHVQVSGWSGYPIEGIAWSPDSSRVAFRIETPGDCVDVDRLIVADRDGGNILRLGAPSIGVSDVSFSPDGSQVLAVGEIEDSAGPSCEYSAHFELSLVRPTMLAVQAPTWTSIRSIDYGSAPVWQPLPCAVTGTEGDDILVGTPGDDVICGLGGDDTLGGSDGDDTFVGGAGIDTLDLSNAPTAVSVDLRSISAVGDGRDVVVGIEDVEGSSFDDVLEGDDGPNMLTAGPGDDLLAGWAGTDVLDAGPGDDVVELVDCVPEDPCTANGGDGVDTARMVRVSELDLAVGTASGGWGTTWNVGSLEWVEGSPWNDVIVGSGERNVVWAGRGDDVVSGLAGDDLLVGGAGNDRLGGGRGYDRCVGGPGQDDLHSCERR